MVMAVIQDGKAVSDVAQEKQRSSEYDPELEERIP